jgi:hypothetical protein
VSLPSTSNGTLKTAIEQIAPVQSFERKTEDILEYDKTTITHSQHDHHHTQQFTKMFGDFVSKSLIFFISLSLSLSDWLCRVTFRSPNDATNVYKALQGKPLDGMTLQIFYQMVHVPHFIPVCSVL